MTKNCLQGFTGLTVMLWTLSAAMRGTAAGLPEEKPLWPQAGWENPIRYDVAEGMQAHQPGKGSLCGSNRVYRFISTPTYSIHEPAPGTANGIGLVICPGGGFRELWLDREGNDLALWLKPRGITSLVLKYQTNTEGADGKRKFSDDVYFPAVIADAREAIRILRSHVARKDGSPGKIGICGFSAGGALAIYTIFESESDLGSKKITGSPDFAGLFYPGLRGKDVKLVSEAKVIPPLFVMNAIDDQMTPVGPCTDFYQALLKAGAKAELHLYNRGGHGFDMGDGHGESVALWKESFAAWLRDSVEP